MRGEKARTEERKMALEWAEARQCQGHLIEEGERL